MHGKVSMFGAALAAVAVAFVLPLLCQANNLETLIVPNGYGDEPIVYDRALYFDPTAWPMDFGYSFLPFRYQEFFPSYQFPGQTIKITGIAFRSAGFNVSATYSLIQNLTISMAYGTPIFPPDADNLDNNIYIGTKQEVLSGEIGFNAGHLGTQVFDTTFTFTNPFIYDPLKEQPLVLDWTTWSTPHTNGMLNYGWDEYPNGIVYRVYNFPPSASVDFYNGTDDYAPIVQFTYEPLGVALNCLDDFVVNEGTAQKFGIRGSDGEMAACPDEYGNLEGVCHILNALLDRVTILEEAVVTFVDLADEELGRKGVPVPGAPEL